MFVSVLLTALASAEEPVDDAMLLEALLELLDREAGALGAQRLADLGDPRALGPLERVVGLEDEPVALAPIGALARFPEGLTPLAGWVQDASLPLDLWIGKTNPSPQAS